MTVAKNGSRRNPVTRRVLKKVEALTVYTNALDVVLVDCALDLLRMEREHGVRFDTVRDVCAALIVEEGLRHAETMLEKTGPGGYWSHRVELCRHALENRPALHDCDRTRPQLPAGAERCVCGQAFDTAPRKPCQSCKAEKTILSARELCSLCEERRKR